MTAIVGHQAAEVTPASSPANLNDLPAEVINIIVQFLRDDDSIKYTPSSKTCRCHPPRQGKKTRKRKALLFSRVPWISLSRVSKRLRNIVFDNCMNRKLSTLLCSWEYERSLEASEEFRHHVTELSIRTLIGHPTPPTTFSLRDLVVLFPDTQHVKLIWCYEVAGTNLELDPTPIGNGFMMNSVKRLDITIGELEGEGKGFGAAELRMLLKHLSPPSVEEFCVNLHMLRLGEDEEEEIWEELGEALQSTIFTKLEDFHLSLTIPVSGPMQVENDPCARLSGLLHIIAAHCPVRSIIVNVCYMFCPAPWVIGLVLRDDGHMQSNYNITKEQAQNLLLDVKSQSNTLETFKLFVDGGIQSEEPELPIDLFEFRYATVSGSSTDPAAQNRDDPLVSRNPQDAVSEGQITHHVYSANITELYQEIWQVANDRSSVGDLFEDYAEELAVWTAAPRRGQEVTAAAVHDI